MIKIEIAGLDDLASEMTDAVRSAWPAIVEATRESGQRTAEAARPLSAASRKGVPATIRSVLSRGENSVTATVSYRSPLGAILEFGTPTSPAYAALGPSLDREGPEFESAVIDAFDKALK